MTDTSAEMMRELQESSIVLQGRSLSNVLQFMKRRVMKLQHAKRHTPEDAAQYKEMLDDIHSRWAADGDFGRELKNVDPEMQAKTSQLYQECQAAVAELAEDNRVDMPPGVRSIYDRLVRVKQGLQELKRAGGQPSLDVLHKLQGELDEVDQQRLATRGVFGGTLQHVPPGQAACSELLNRCYEMVAEMSGRTAEPSDAMRSVLSNLAGIKSALLRIKEHGPHTAEDIRHYQQMLDAIDGRRRDGVFCGNLASGNIPAGQAQASELLAQAYELMHELLATAHEMPAAMEEIYKKLAKYYGMLSDMKQRPHSIAQIKSVQWHVDEIDGARKDGIFGGDLHSIPPGQAICSSLLHECYRLVHNLYGTATDVEAEPSAVKKGLVL